MLDMHTVIDALNERMVSGEPFTRQGIKQWLRDTFPDTAKLTSSRMRQFVERRLRLARIAGLIEATHDGRKVIWIKKGV